MPIFYPPFLFLTNTLANSRYDSDLEDSFDLPESLLSFPSDMQNSFSFSTPAASGRLVNQAQVRRPLQMTQNNHRNNASIRNLSPGMQTVRIYSLSQDLPDDCDI